MHVFICVATQLFVALVGESQLLTVYLQLYTNLHRILTVTV